jgi:hypothetical protein
MRHCRQIGIPVEEVGKKIKELNEILKEHGMVLKAENNVGICFWKDENTAVSLKLEVVLLSDNKEKEEKNG